MSECVRVTNKTSIRKISDRMDLFMKNRFFWYKGEKKKCFGLMHPDEVVYIVRRDDKCGLGSFIVTNIRMIKEAIDKEWIPVIDMKNYRNAYQSDDEIGKENVWEYYFEQPDMKVGLKEAYQCRNVILSDVRIPKEQGDKPGFNIKFLNNENLMEEYRKIVSRYVRLNEKTKIYIDKIFDDCFDKSDRILGVVVRGTDYTTQKPKNHPIQPTIEQAIEKTREIVQEQMCKKIFLATEDKTIYDAFSQAFGKQLVTNPKEYIKYRGG